jgi:hypothetical protein
MSVPLLLSFSIDQILHFWITDADHHSLLSERFRRCLSEASVFFTARLRK